MYEVQMRYVDKDNCDLFNFRCESFNINNDGYTFENITVNNFNIVDLEVSNDEIALIKIK